MFYGAFVRETEIADGGVTQLCSFAVNNWDSKSLNC